MTEEEFEVQKALGPLRHFAVRIPRDLSPNTGQVYYKYVIAINEKDAINRACSEWPELALYKLGLVAHGYYVKDNGQMHWESI
jgi:hypothetical protein